MTDVTQILSQIEHGDPNAAQQLLPLVYDQLRQLAAAKLANEKSGQTLQATALVHEAYLRLVDTEKIQRWDSRGHFFAAAAEAMRRILIDKARSRKRARHGGEFRRVNLLDVDVMDVTPDEQLLRLDEALTRAGKRAFPGGRIGKAAFFYGTDLGRSGADFGNIFQDGQTAVAVRTIVAPPRNERRIRMKLVWIEVFSEIVGRFSLLLSHCTLKQPYHVLLPRLGPDDD